MILAPVIEGTAPIRTAAPAFREGLARRVAQGLLTGQPHPRSQYVVTETGADHMRIRATDWKTALNVGLNDIDLRFPESGVVQYQVRYWRWAAYALGLCGAIGMVGLLLLLLADARSYIESQPGRMVPGISADQNIVIVWGLVLFWGFVWPWLLIAVHRRPLRRLVERIIGEVDAAGVPAGSPRRAA